MEFIGATDRQLIQVINEDCPIEYKYEACRELQLRSFTEDMIPDLVRMWGNGCTGEEISEWLGIPTYRVYSIIRNYRLKRIG